jgi:predicted GNAT family N-acyltransferase
VHVLAQVDGQTVGTGRLLLDAPAGGTAHIGRVAVLPSHRQQGVGNALMRALHDEAQARGFSGIAISAQTHALAFYQSLGYRAQGETYIEAGIEHQRMTREF